MAQPNKLWELIKLNLINSMFVIITTAVISIAGFMWKVADNTNKMVYGFKYLSERYTDVNKRVDTIEDKIYIIDGKVIELDKRTSIMERTYGKND